MNQESVFALRFVVKDLAKMRKAMESVNENLRKMQENAGKTTKGFDKVNTSLGKATRSLLRFGLVYFSVSKIIGGIFNRAQEAIQANVSAITAGVDVNKIKRLGRAVQDFGGDVRSAGSAYTNMTNIIGGARHGFGISEDVERVNAMFGIGFNYGNITQDQLLTQIAKSMNRLKGQGNQWGINQIASAYGLDEATAAMLAKYGAGWKKHTDKQKIDNIGLSEAQRMLKAQKDIETQVGNFANKLIPKITSVLEYVKNIAENVDVIATPIKQTLTKIGETAGKLLYPPQTAKPITSNAKIEYAKGLYEKGKIPLEKYLSIIEVMKQEDAYKKGTLTLEQYNAFRSQNGMKPYTVNVNIDTINTKGGNPKEIGKEVGKSVAKTFNSPRSNTI